MKEVHVMGLFGPPDVTRLRAKSDVSGLIKALDYKGDRQVASEAAAALGEIKDPRAVRPLLDAVRFGFNARAADALGEIGDASVVGPLVGILRGRQTFGRDLAARALGRLGNREAVGPLIDALTDADQKVRWAASRALRAIGDVRAIDPLWGALFHAGDAMDRDAFALALVLFPGGRGSDRLIDELEKTESFWWQNPDFPDGHVVFSGDVARRALIVGGGGHLNDPQGYDPTGDEVAKAVLARLDKAIKTRGPGSRRLLVGLFAEIGGRRAVRTLTGALEDPDDSVREAAASGLRQLSEPAASGAHRKR
jgi:HEAT repeat protein